MKTARVCVIGLALGCTATPSKTEASKTEAESNAGGPTTGVDADEPLPEPEGRGLARLGSELGDLSEACELLRARECPTMGHGRCLCFTDQSDESVGWALLQLTNPEERLDVWYPAIRTTSGWTVFRQLLVNQTTGVWGYYEYTEWGTPLREDLLPGGERELVFSFEKQQESADNASLPEDNTLTWKMRSVCGREGARAQCTRPLLDEYSYLQTSRETSEVYGSGRYRATIVLGAEVVVSDVTGVDELSGYEEYNDEVLVLPRGVHSLAELLAPDPRIDARTTKSRLE